MKTAATKRKPQEPEAPTVPLESLEDVAWGLWLLVELLAPVRRRMPNTTSQKLVDFIKDRLIAKSVAIAKWKKLHPELFAEASGSRRVARRKLDFPGTQNLGGNHSGSSSTDT